MMRGRITYIGALGNENMGDEALYQISRRVFNQYDLVPSLRRQPSGITLLGGGTLIPEWTVLVLPNRYNYAFGVGVKNPSFFESTQPLWIHPVTIEQTKRFDFRLFGVRGNMSKRTLEKWGIDCEVVGDPCLLFEPTKYDRKDESRIGINVGWSRGGIWGGDEKLVQKETTELCKTLIAEGFEPVLIPFWFEDVPYIQRISTDSNVEIFEDWANTQKLLDFISSCHVLVGLKLHSLVFSAATHTPFVSIEYRPKCQDFADSVGFNDYNIKTSEVSAGRLGGMIHNLIDNWDEMHEILRENVGLYRQKLRVFAERIVNDIESLPDDKWSPRYLSVPKWFVHKYLNLVRKRIS